MASCMGFQHFKNNSIQRDGRLVSHLWESGKSRSLLRFSPGRCMTASSIPSHSRYWTRTEPGAGRTAPATTQPREMLTMLDTRMNGASMKLQLTVALVVRKRASWLMLETSGELFMINRTLEMGREIVFLASNAGSSFSGRFCDIFTKLLRDTDKQNHNYCCGYAAGFFLVFIWCLSAFQMI